MYTGQFRLDVYVYVYVILSVLILQSILHNRNFVADSGKEART